MFEVRKVDSKNVLTVKDLLKLRNEIDFKPYYQRYGNIWSLENKRLLLDSIINGYDIPKFYFHFLPSNIKGLNESGKKYAIIDGKQRILTLLEFMDEEFKLDESVKYLKNPDLKLKNKSYYDLFKENFEIYTIIENYRLDIVHIITDELDRIEEMFARLNEGMPVNNAEKRNSFGGYLMGRINKIVESHSFFMTKVKFGNKRMEHQDLMSKLVLLEEKNTLESFTKKNLDDLIKKNKTKNKIIDEALSNVLIQLDFFSSIFKEKDELLKSKGIIPLFYWYTKNNKTNKNFYKFILEFEKLRTFNRTEVKTSEANVTLLEFDRLNQQGANQSKSLGIRYQIFKRFFDFYTKNKKIDLTLKMTAKELGIERNESEPV